MRAILLVIAVLLAGAGCVPLQTPPSPSSQEGVAGASLPLVKGETEGVPELRVPVLMYHHVGTVPARDPYGLFVSTSTFRAQMQALKDDGWSVVTMPALADALEGKQTLPKKSVVISFDDGNRDTSTGAFPILQEFRYDATVFVMTGPSGNKAASYLPPDLLRELMDAGWTIAPHTRWHETLTRVPEALAREEVVSSVEFLAREVGVREPYFAYPNGEENETVRGFLREAGIRYAFTIHEGVVTTSSDPLALPRLRMGEDYGVQKFLERLRAAAVRG
ncbi:MAG: polysaccharide deacetylase family protein [Patescibacteria group bacterium]